MTASIEALKEKARRHEQDEEWRKALDLYLRAIRRLDEEDRPDIGLHNRVGDLFTRVGEADAAVEHYETAVDLYEDADLPNNAIAVCKKILRNVPGRHRVFLRMGLIRARQGFVVDARDHFLTYAGRVRADGDVDEALRALVEFADLVPDDAEVRLALAAQYEAHEHVPEAVEQLGLAYATLRAAGETERAEEIAAKLGELDPDTDPDSFEARSPAPAADTVAGGFEATALGGFGPSEPAAQAHDTVDELDGLDDFEISLVGEEADDDTEVVAVDDDTDDETETGVSEAEALADEAALTLDQPLPFMSFDDEDEAEPDDEPYDQADDELYHEYGDEFGDESDDDATPLPFLEGTADLAPPVEPSAPMPGRPDLDAAESWTEPDVGPAPDDVSPEMLGTVEPPVSDEAMSESDEFPLADEDPADDDEPSPEESLSEVVAQQRAVEDAFRSGDETALTQAYLGLAEALESEGDDERARGVYQQVLALDPSRAEALAGLERVAGESGPVAEVASSEDYVDLGALILGDDAEKTTRFVVAYEEPSGDEDADFARMLSQFKAKVAQNVDASDVRAHHDLGMAYREMGLLDEAIEQFQKALRASADHLATYEALGQAFLEKDAPAAAVRVLTRALDAPWEVEDELLGIYYYLGRAYEAQGHNAQAVDFYDRVFSLDINFADVTERLRVLR